MKRGIIAVLLLILWASCGVAEGMDKYEAMPPMLVAAVTGEEGEVQDGKAYIYKEYLETTNQEVNAELREIVEEYAARRSGELAPDPKGRGKQNSRLDVDTVYYRTGDRWISTMVLARVVWYREQLSLDMTTRTYNLETGERVWLTDLFDVGSAGWEVLSQGVREQLSRVFPDEPRAEDAIIALSDYEALAQADFTLSGMELTLHYHTDEIFEGKEGLLHVRFYYPELQGMLSPEGALITDNSRWKMVTFTCDDGPKDYQSTYALNAFRKVGARVTYFVVGKQLERYGDVFQRQMDQNHSFGSHSYNHWSGYSFKRINNRLKELDKSDALTLQLVGEKAPFFRAPGGTYPPWVEAKMPVPIIQWSLDTYDYTGKPAEKILYSIEKNIEQYDIILCHDTGKYLHEAVPLFAEYLAANGYMMVTLEELLAAQGQEAKENVVYWSFRPGENNEERSGKK